MLPARARRISGRLRFVAVVAVVAAGLLAGASDALAASGPTLAGSTQNTSTIAGADAITMGPFNYAYAAAYWNGTLTAIDVSNPFQPVVAGESAPTNGLLNASNVAVANGYAYVVSKNRNGTKTSHSNDDGSGNSLTVLDVGTNPSSPAVLGTLHDPVNLFGAYGVAVSGSYAFVAAQGCLSNQPCPNPNVGNSFDVVDVSNPAAPTLVATLSNSNLPAPYTGTNALQHACSVAVYGNYAYVTAAYANRLTVIDISNPLAPQIVSSVQDSTAFDFDVDVAVEGGYAYVADQALGVGRVAVVDVSNPAQPRVAGMLTNKTWLNGAYRIRARGDFAYVSAAYSADVAAVDVSNPAHPRFAGGYKDTSLLNRTTGLDFIAATEQLVAVSPFLSTESSPLYPPYPPAPGSPTNTGTVSLVNLDPVPLTVTISPSSEPPNPTSRTSASFSFSTSDSVASVACSLDLADFVPCTTTTTQTYSGLAYGTHTFTVQATDPAGNTETDSYTWTIAVAPTNQARPVVSGQPVVGQTLTGTTGTWSGTQPITYAYQWQDCNSTGGSCTPIAGATSASYVVASSDTGLTLRLQVTATNAGGSASASSTQTAVVTGPPTPPVNQSVPVVSGQAVVGQTVSGSNGSWSGSQPISYAYQWEDCDSSGANCSAIGGATGSSYLVAASDVGFTLVLQVTASNSAGQQSASSAPTAVVSQSGGGGGGGGGGTGPSGSSVLDDFNRANGPVGSAWSVVYGGFTSFSVSGNVAVDSSSTSYAWEFWNGQQFGPDSEAFATVESVSGDVVRVCARMVTPGGSGRSGYCVQQKAGSWSVVRLDKGTSVQLGSAVTQSVAVGDRVGIVVSGSSVQAWYAPAGGSWTQLESQTDSTYTAAGYLALESRGSAIDDFGGGTI